jgi:hypothetical protein
VNWIRNEFPACFGRAIRVVRLPDPAIKGVPAFTERELAWIKENVHSQEERDFLYNARVDDDRYQILPNDLVARPADKPALPQEKLQDAFSFIDDLWPGRKARGPIPKPRTDAKEAEDGKPQAKD